jgi:hypothetical protein
MKYYDPILKKFTRELTEKEIKQAEKNIKKLRKQLYGDQNDTTKRNNKSR